MIEYKEKENTSFEENFKQMSWGKVLLYAVGGYLLVHFVLLFPPLLLFFIVIFSICKLAGDEKK